MNRVEAHKASILIVDDDVDAATLLQRMLEVEGYLVTTVATGNQGIERFAELHPDLVLLDAVLPDLDGFEICTKLQGLPGGPATPLLMMTSLGEDRKLIERAFAAGAVDYINKPVQGQWIVLRRRIQRLVEAKRAEEALQRERNLLRTLIDNVPDTIFIKDTQSRFVDANMGTARILGAASPADLIGKTDFDFFPKDLADGYFASEQNLLKTGQPMINIEEPILNHQTGEMGWILTTNIPLKDSQGAIIGLVGIGKDITDRKQAQEALEGERLLLRTVIDNIPDYIFAKDLEGRFLISNVAHAQAGQAPTAEELVGKSAFDLFPRDMAAQFDSDDKALMQSGEALINAERRTVDPNGNDRFVLTTKVPLKDPKGKTIGLVGISRDITVRKKAQESLDSERVLLRTLIDNIPDYIYVKNLEGKYILANLAVSRMLGMTAPTEMVGRTAFEVFAKELAAEYVREDQQVLQTGQPLVNFEELTTDHLGNGRWILATKLPLRDADGKVTGILGVSRDITERKQVEKTLAQERESNRALHDEIRVRLRIESELEELNRLKTEFLSTAAHELRTPLTSIRGFSELLLYREVSLDRQKYYVQLIYDQATQLGNIINDLLDLSRLEAKRVQSLTLETLNVSDLLHHVATPLIVSASRHSFSFEGLNDDLVVTGDASRISQVVKNLISNAIKYSPEGGIITISCDILEHTLRIGVRDEGPGMTPAQQSHLFEPFYRADASNTAIGGTGLGLAICKSIIELHGGKIWVESETGQGTVFYFTLPLKPMDSSVASQ